MIPNSPVWRYVSLSFSPCELLEKGILGQFIRSESMFISYKKDSRGPALQTGRKLRKE